MKASVKNGLIFGLLIGAIAAFLFAPKSGKELRGELKDKINAVPNQFFNFLESLVDLMVAIIDFAKETFEEQSQRISNAVSCGIDAAKGKSEELRKLVVKGTNNN